MFVPDSELLAHIDRLAEEVFALSVRLTDHPEVSGEEKESCAAVTDFLARRGYEITAPYGGIDYSFRARPRGSGPKRPRAAILCEYDALPEIGHACGHSLSCGISLLTALALEALGGDLGLTFDLVGTPAEETLGGKVVMTENGAFDGYVLAAMAHLDNVNAPQTRALASNDMYLTFLGRAAHASFNPADGINAFNAAQLFCHAADLWRQHLPPDRQFHGIITRGGAAPNIVPDRVEMDYYLRSATLKGLADLRAKLTDCARGAALATGCEYTIEQRTGTYGDLFYPQAAESRLVEIYQALGLDWQICEKPGGSTDLGNVDMVTPTLALCVKATDRYIPLHTREFTAQLYGERGLKTLVEGTRIQASLLLDLARRPEFLADIREEHRRYRAENSLK